MSVQSPDPGPTTTPAVAPAPAPRVDDATLATVARLTAPYLRALKSTNPDDVDDRDVLIEARAFEVVDALHAAGVLVLTDTADRAHMRRAWAAMTRALHMLAQDEPLPVEVLEAVPTSHRFYLMGHEASHGNLTRTWRRLLAAREDLAAILRRGTVPSPVTLGAILAELGGEDPYAGGRPEDADPWWGCWTDTAAVPETFDWKRYERTIAPDARVDDLGDLCAFLGGTWSETREGASVTALILWLIVKAQATPERMAAVERAFPREVTAWRVWMPMSPSPTAQELYTELARSTPTPAMPGPTPTRVPTGEQGPLRPKAFSLPADTLLRTTGGRLRFESRGYPRVVADTSSDQGDPHALADHARPAAGDVLVTVTGAVYVVTDGDAANLGWWAAHVVGVPDADVDSLVAEGVDPDLAEAVARWYAGVTNFRPEPAAGTALPEKWQGAATWGDVHAAAGSLTELRTQIDARAAELTRALMVADPYTEALARGPFLSPDATRLVRDALPAALRDQIPDWARIYAAPWPAGTRAVYDPVRGTTLNSDGTEVFSRVLYVDTSNGPFYVGTVTKLPPHEQRPGSQMGWWECRYCGLGAVGLTRAEAEQAECLGHEAICPDQDKMDLSIPRTAQRPRSAVSPGDPDWVEGFGPVPGASLGDLGEDR